MIMCKVFIDLEMNRVSKDFTEIRKQCLSEIIQIGAVRIDEQAPATCTLGDMFDFSKLVLA